MSLEWDKSADEFERVSLVKAGDKFRTLRAKNMPVIELINSSILVNGLAFIVGTDIVQKLLNMVATSIVRPLCPF